MNLSYSAATPLWTMLPVAGIVAAFIFLDIGRSLRISGGQSSFSFPGRQLPTQADLQDQYRVASRLAASVAVGISFVVLLGGWLCDIPGLKSVIPGAESMKANTALGLAMLGSALWLNGYRRLTAGSRRVVLILAGGAVLLGTIVLLEYATGWNFHIDEILFRDDTGIIAWKTPGRMAFTTATSFVLLGSALLLSKYRGGALFAQLCSGLVGFLCIVSLVPYVYGIENYRGNSFYTGVAMHTSLTLLILCAGILFSTATQGCMATVTSRHLGGVMARRLLPSALILPVALGWLRWQGQLRGYYDTAFGLAIFVSANVGVFLLLLWANGALLNRLDQERLGSYASLRESEANFRQLADSMPQIVWSARADGWLDYCNERWVNYTGLTVVQARGWGSLAAIHPDDAPSVVHAWNHAVETGNDSNVEFRLKRSSDGAYRWHLGRGVAMRDDTGRILRWFGTSTDIDDHKRAQQALEEARQQLELRVQQRTAELEKSNTLLSAILDSMGDGVICVNEKYEHILFNHAARKLLGWGPSQAHPNQRAEVFGVYHADKKTRYKTEELPLGRALRGENCDNLEIFGLPPEQEQGVWLSANSRPVKDSAGRLRGAVLVLHDISQRKQAEETQARLLAILEETSDFVGTARPDGTIFYANRALRRLRGVGEGDSIEGMRIEGMYPPRVVEQTLNDAVRYALKYGSWRGENVFRYHTGEEIPVSQLIMSHRNREGEVEFMSTVARDISEIKDNEAKLQVMQEQLEASLAKERELSRSDALTGLPNRRAFLEIARSEKERSGRHSHCFSLAYLDLDGFKKINDSLGHSIGDEVLATVAKVLRSNLRASDTVARLGGDEFAILLPETDPSAAKKVVAKLQELLRTAMWARGWKVDFSIGLASFLRPPESLDYIIRTADELMYSVKNHGKGALAAAILG